MSRDERKSLVQAIKHRASLLTNIWKPPGLILPPLNLPGFDNSMEGMVDVYQALWDWQDQCLAAMRQFRDETVERYDFSSFEDVFSGLARLDALHGDFYMACYNALQARSQMPERI